MTRLRALRRRFIIVNMTTITATLLLILGVVIIGNVQHYQSVATEALHMLVNLTNPVNTLSSTDDDKGAKRFSDADREGDQPLSVEQDSADSASENDSSAAPDDTPPPSSHSELSASDQKAAAALPGIVLAVSDDYSEVEILFTRNMDTSEATAQALAAAVHAAGTSEGALIEYDLSYSVRETPEGTKIAFVDRSYETANIKNLVLISAFCFIAAWLAFLFVVWRLSGWVFRPVEQAWSQQRQFIADASHELKTPITVILANMRILENHKEDTIAQQMRWIESSDQEALRMKKLVSDMLLLARNDANEDQPVARQSVDFSDLVLGAILSFEAVALDNGLLIAEDIDRDCLLEGDREQLQELITILLDNACKYAPSGSTIDVRLRRQERQLQLAVHNKSDAIDEEALAHLFERFYRVDASRTRDTGGYGLGLAIADSICQRHHGHITATNENGGVTFLATLPLAQKHKLHG